MLSPAISGIFSLPASLCCICASLLLFSGKILFPHKRINDIARPLLGGLIGLTWGGLFKLSYLPGKRREAKSQLKKEIRAQIGRVGEAVETPPPDSFPLQNQDARIITAEKEVTVSPRQ